MKSRLSLVILVLAAGLPPLLAPALLAQEIDEELEAPVPLARPEGLEGQGRVAPPEPFPQVPVTTDPQPVILSARTGEDGPFISSGLVWRIFDTQIDETGE